MVAKTTAPRREKTKRRRNLDHNGLFRKKPGQKQQIVINPRGRSAPPEPITAEQRASLERRRRVERHLENSELAQATGEVWDEST